MKITALDNVFVVGQPCCTGKVVTHIEIKRQGFALGAAVWAGKEFVAWVSPDLINKIHFSRKDNE